MVGLHFKSRPTIRMSLLRFFTCSGVMETSTECLKLGNDNLYILFPVCFSLNNVSLDATGALFRMATTVTHFLQPRLNYTASLSNEQHIG